MAKRTEHIPVNRLDTRNHAGIIIAQIGPLQLLQYDEASHAHRHDFHVFLFVPQGRLLVEIDFNQYVIDSGTILYIHPNQVHRILEANTQDAVLMGISAECLQPGYLQKLEETLSACSILETTAANNLLVLQTVNLCIEVSRQQFVQDHPGLLQDYCNAFVGLYLSLRARSVAPTQTRYEAITRSFTILLEQEYKSTHRPTDYANELHISLAYLNECVRHTTGHSVTHQIQQRIVLEAKRLLFHSEQSVKQIATDLGFQDHAYFSRRFAKATGTSASDFRAKNRG